MRKHIKNVINFLKWYHPLELLLVLMFIVYYEGDIIHWLTDKVYCIITGWW